MSTSGRASWYVQQDGRLRYWNGKTWTSHFLDQSTLDPGRYRHIDGSLRHWNGHAWGPPDGTDPVEAPPKRTWWRARRFWIAGAVALALIIGTVVLAGPSSADVRRTHH